MIADLVRQGTPRREMRNGGWIAARTQVHLLPISNKGNVSFIDVLVLDATSS